MGEEEEVVGRITLASESITSPAGALSRQPCQVQINPENTRTRITEKNCLVDKNTLLLYRARGGYREGIMFHDINWSHNCMVPPLTSARFVYTSQTRTSLIKAHTEGVAGG